MHPYYVKKRQTYCSIASLDTKGIWKMKYKQRKFKAHWISPHRFHYVWEPLKLVFKILALHIYYFIVTCFKAEIRLYHWGMHTCFISTFSYNQLFLYCYLHMYNWCFRVTYFYICTFKIKIKYIKVQEVFHPRPTGRRPQGRPRTDWKDYISLLEW